MASSPAPTLEILTDLVRDRARAEAREIAAMLEFRDGEIVRTDHVQPAMRRQVERAAVPMAIGDATGMSEGQIQLRLFAADTVRRQAGQAWAAFVEGTIDFSRIRDIAHTIDQLKRPESIARLDKRVVAYATDHTAAELRGWLRRFVQRVEADLAVERAETERGNRYISIKHGDNGMGWLNAYLPSHQLAAIEQRTHREARKSAPDDSRTAAQREADLLVSWCTTSNETATILNAHIAVTIDADVLAGAVEGFAESSDGRWAVPAGWITEVARAGNPFWHRIVLEPVSGDVLSHEYVGRFSPDVLDVALAFRDGVCQAPGCMVPAQLCDIDHREAWPAGSTNAANLGPLCRRHHNFKSHGVLRWSIGSPQAPPRHIAIEIYREPVLMELAA